MPAHTVTAASKVAHAPHVWSAILEANQGSLSLVAVLVAFALAWAELFRQSRERAKALNEAISYSSTHLTLLEGYLNPVVKHAYKIEAVLLQMTLAIRTFDLIADANATTNLRLALDALTGAEALRKYSDLIQTHIGKGMKLTEANWEEFRESVKDLHLKPY